MGWGMPDYVPLGKLHRSVKAANNSSKPGCVSDLNLIAQ
jgi:hypothetical protein